LNVDLTPDFSTSKCVKVDPSKCIQTKEGFEVGSGNTIGVVALLAVVLTFCFLRK
jgi:hypothetical protein